MLELQVFGGFFYVSWLCTLRLGMVIFPQIWYNIQVHLKLVLSLQ